MSSPILQSPTDIVYVAWKKVHGNKAIVFTAYCLISLVVIAFATFGFIFNVLIHGADQAFGVLGGLINFVFQSSLVFIGIQIAKDLPTHYRMILYGFRASLIAKVILVYIMIMLIIWVPSLVIGAIAHQLHSSFNFVLYIISLIIYIYLSVRVSLAIGLVVDKHDNPWKAILTSFDLTADHIWSLFLTYLLVFVIVIVSVIPLGIGLIWTLPLALISYGVIYKQLTSHLPA